MRLFNYLYGAALGAGMMYLLDPDQGRRRRALVRDQYDHLRRQSMDMVDDGVRDLRNRARGLAAEGVSRISGQPVDDYVLSERARSRLGFLVGYPGSVNVDVQNGTLHLSGDVLESDAERLTQGMSNIRGVNAVVNNLKTHQEPSQIPNLPENFSMERNPASGMWSPSTRLLASTGALYMLMRGMRGGLLGRIFTLAGLGLGLRAITNKPVREALGMTRQGEMINVTKNINIDAPVDRVYSMWANFEQFPRFMSNVMEIRSMGEDRHHWTVKGPADVPVEFDTMITDHIPNEVIAWQTLPESMVQHRGHVRFRDDRRGGTQVNVRMSYSPPAGVVGHMVASFFGKDPKSSMDQDLMRFTSLIEYGKTRTEGETVREEDLKRV